MEGRRVDDLNRCFKWTHTYHTYLQCLNCYTWKQIPNTVQQIKPDAKPWNYWGRNPLKTVSALARHLHTTTLHHGNYVDRTHPGQVERGTAFFF